MSGTIPNQFKSNSKKPVMNSNGEDGDEEEDGFDVKRTLMRSESGVDGEYVDGEDDGDSSSRTSLMSRSATSIIGNSATSVQVALRIRPLLPREVIANARECIKVADNEPQVWIAGTHAFTYDHVFNTEVAQDHIFDVVAKPLVDGILEGYNATILAYGQTGSGKTYTMGTGFDPNLLMQSSTTNPSAPSPSNPQQGLLPRCISYLFELIKRTKSAPSPPDFTIHIQFTELYNEEVIDLLARPTSANNRQQSAVKIHEQANGQIYLVNINTLPVTTANETLDILKNGALNRTTASTNMNDSSSRSHAIFSIMVTQNRVIRDKLDGQQDLETLQGKFHFVDLAGSERLKRTLATGDRAREGIAINSGLLALGNVISALGDRSKKGNHVPYRDSKLTRLLQDSLGGNSRTLMIACVSPNELDFVETLNTMKYANRAKNIKNKVVVNQDKSSRTICLLREEIAALKNELMELKRRGGGGGVSDEFGGDVCAENIMLLAELDTLRIKVKSKSEMVDKLTSQVARLQAVSITRGMVGAGEGGEMAKECDLTGMVSKYLVEIEELRGRLYESESECEKLRAKQRVILKNLSSPGRESGGGGNNGTVLGDEVGELLKSARSEVEMERRAVVKGKGGEKKAAEEEMSDEDGELDEYDSDEDDDGVEEDPNEQNYTELANLNQEINTKQRLIEELENSQLRLESLKNKYEEKLSSLSAKIRSTEEERDAFMAKQPRGGSARGVNGARQKELNNDKRVEYETKIASLQGELKKWAAAKREHGKLLRDKSQYEGQIMKLRGEVEEMKRVKVRLMNQVRNENLRFREVEKVRMREISQLRKEGRLNEVRMRKLESDGVRKDAVLKRKLQEVEMLKKLRGNGRGRAGSATTISPVKGKQVWGRIHASLVKDVNSRCSVAALEREMVGLISRRSELRGELEGEKDPDSVDSIETNLGVVEEKIRAVQDEIVCANEVGGGGGGIGAGSKKRGGSGEPGVLSGRMRWRNWGECAVEADYAYVVEKLYEQSVAGLSEVGLLEGRVKETEEVNKQLQIEVDTLRDLLHHIYTRGYCAGIDEVRPPSSLSTTSLNPEDNKLLMPPPPPPPQVREPPPPTTTKARRRLTATTQELLGAADNGGVDYEDGPQLGRTFTRNTRLTQSLRGSGRGNGRGPPPFLRQDTYCVGEEEDGGIMNRTFVLSEGTNNLAQQQQTETLSDQTNPFAATAATATSATTNNSNNKMVLQRSVSEIEGGGYNGRGRVGREGNGDANGRTGQVGSGGVVKPPRSNAWLQLQGSLDGHTKPILCLCSTESMLISGSKDGSCRVWDLESKAEVACFDGHPHNVSCVAYLEDVGVVLTGSSYQLRVFDLRCKDVVKVMGSSGLPLSSSLSAYQPPPIPSLPTSTPLPRVNELPHGEKQISFIQRVRNYFYTSMGDRIKIWDVRKLTSLGLLAGKHNSSVMCSTGVEAGVRGSDWVVTGSKDHSINVYEYGCGTPPENISRTKNLSPVHYDGVECLYLGGGGSGKSYLFSGSRDTCIKKWDLESYRMVSTVTSAHAGWVTGIAGIPRASGGNGEFIVSCSRDGSVKMWDCGGKEFREVCRYEGGGGSIECVESNSACLFFSGGGSNAISLYNVNDKILNLIIQYRDVVLSDQHDPSPSSPLLSGSMSASFHRDHHRSHSSSVSRLNLSPSASPKFRRKLLLQQQPRTNHHVHVHYVHNNNNRMLYGSSDDIMSSNNNNGPESSPIGLYKLNETFAKNAFGGSTYIPSTVNTRARAGGSGGSSSLA